MCCCCSTIYSLLALHIHGSQLTLSNTHAFHHVETSEQACRPILLGLRHHVWDYSRDGSNLHHRRVRLASPGRRMRFAYVLILGITWGTEWSRWIQTGQMFLVHCFCIEALFRLVSFPMFSCLCRLATHVDLQGLGRLHARAGRASMDTWSRFWLHQLQGHVTRCRIRCLLGFCLELAARCS